VRETPRLTATTSSFVLAATVTVLVNTVLACAKDAYAPFKASMKSLAGHDWTAQGCIDLILFVALGLIFMNTGLAERIGATRLIRFLVAAVAISALGLAAWYALF
jgi:hypothetical protein